MADWDMSEWEKPYVDKYKILVIDTGRIVAIMPLPSMAGVDPCGAINAGLKEVAKEYSIKSITSVQENVFEGTSHTTELILMIEPKIVSH